MAATTYDEALQRLLAHEVATVISRPTPAADEFRDHDCGLPQSKSGPVSLVSFIR
jgi:hypothetical protein